MGNFLLTATDFSGKRDTLRVEADSSQDAWRQLDEQGYSDIVLHTSDAEALTPMTALDSGKITPAEIIQIRGRSRAGFFWFLTRQLYVKSRWAIAMSIVLLAIRLSTSQELGFVGWLAIAMLVLPVVVAGGVVLLGKSVKYNRFVEAQAWGRWEDVLKLSAPFRTGTTAFDAAAREACALAGLGRLEEGLRRIEECPATPQTPRWMYLSRVAEVYDVAKLHDKGIACHELALEDAPDNAIVQLGLALALLRSERETDRARQLLDAVEAQHLSDLLLMMLPHVQGLYALNTKDFAEAKRLLLVAHDKLQKLAAASPLLGVMIDVNRAYLAIALAGLREQREAERQFSLARPRLAALDSKRVLERAERALRKL